MNVISGYLTHLLNKSFTKTKIQSIALQNEVRIYTINVVEIKKAFIFMKAFNPVGPTGFEPVTPCL